VLRHREPPADPAVRPVQRACLPAARASAPEAVQAWAGARLDRVGDWRATLVWAAFAQRPERLRVLS